MLHVPELVHDGLDWRSAVTADDVGRVRVQVASTGFFNAAEIELAAGLSAVLERIEGSDRLCFKPARPR